MLKITFFNRDLLFNTFLIYIFLSPTKEVFYFLGYLLLIINIRNFQLQINRNLTLKLLIVGVIFLSYITNINESIGFKDYLNAFNIILLIFLFPYFKSLNFKVWNSSIVFIAIAIILSQLAFIYNLSILKTLILKIYESDDSGQSFELFINANRNGGLYFNPNQASKYLTILFAFSLIILQKKYFRLFTVATICVSIFLTGSRTGFFIALVILFYYIFIIQKRTLPGIIAILIGAISLFLNEALLKNNRSLRLDETSSFDYKISSLLDYINIILTKEEILHFGIGTFTANYKSLMNRFNLSNTYEFGFDSEIGMIISFLGIFPFIILLFFYFKQFFFLKHSEYFILVIPFLFWPLTSTILFSFKTSMVYMVILGIGVSLIFNLRYKSLINKN